MSNFRSPPPTLSGFPCLLYVGELGVGRGVGIGKVEGSWQLCYFPRTLPLQQFQVLVPSQWSQSRSESPL